MHEVVLTVLAEARMDRDAEQAFSFRDEDLAAHISEQRLVLSFRSFLQQPKFGRHLLGNEKVPIQAGMFFEPYRAVETICRAVKRVDGNWPRQTFNRPRRAGC